MSTKVDRVRGSKERKDLVKQVKETATKSCPPDPVVRLIPTKVSLYDQALGGGYPVGQIINIVGDTCSGKTFLACEFIAAARSLLKDKLEWFFDDVENRFSFNTKNLYGFDIIKKDQENSFTIEDFSRNLKSKLAKLKPGKTLIYVLDSFDTLSSEAEQKRDEKEKEKGTYNLEKVKALGEFFRLRKKEIKDKDCILIIISQVRENIGLMFGPRYYRTGGKALDHMASVIVWIGEIEKHKRKNLTYGVSVKARVTKVGNNRPFRECIMRIVFDYGVDNIAGNIIYLYDMYTDKGQMKDKIKDMEFDWDDKKYTFKELIRFIEDNNLESELEARVVEKWEKFESSISSKNRKNKW